MVIVKEENVNNKCKQSALYCLDHKPIPKTKMYNMYNYWL